jgi:MoaA/NifB/PqqE/SkfB family radical SAM enzyme
MNQEDIKWLHIELSSKCNAWCPACPRNKNGFGLIDGLVEEDLSLTNLEMILKQLPNLIAVQLCGTYGDSIASAKIIPAINIIKQYASKIQIHTNGSLRNTEWWKKLATLLKDIEHDVWFGLDGLDGVHEIYRQGTSYTKIINNARAFINNGGNATWQFIPYGHNEHQVKDCIRLSQKLKFKQFKLVKLFRNKTMVRHYQTGDSFELLPPKEFQHIIRMPNANTQVPESNCMHLTQPSIYIAASGKLSHCCYKRSPEYLFDTLDELLYNSANLQDKICLESCGI